MRRHMPDSDELDDEIRGHMALSLKERIERGEHPEAARLAALKEFGNVTLTRDSIRRVWRPRWFDAADAREHRPESVEQEQAVVGQLAGCVRHGVQQQDVLQRHGQHGQKHEGQDQLELQPRQDQLDSATVFHRGTLRRIESRAPENRPMRGKA